MIITCPQCKKKFKIDDNLIPVEGRELKCGSCDNVWFYKNDNKITEFLTLDQDETLSENQKDIKDEVINEIPEIPKEYNEATTVKLKNKDDEIIKKENKDKKVTKFEKKGKRTNIKFFSYLIVFILSFVALIILLDTLKTPLTNVFPQLEIILFNLFETLKDIKLFIIDLS